MRSISIPLLLAIGTASFGQSSSLVLSVGYFNNSIAKLNQYTQSPMLELKYKYRMDNFSPSMAISLKKIYFNDYELIEYNFPYSIISNRTLSVVPNVELKLIDNELKKFRLDGYLGVGFSYFFHSSYLFAETGIDVGVEGARLDVGFVNKAAPLIALGVDGRLDVKRNKSIQFNAGSYLYPARKSYTGELLYTVGLGIKSHPFEKQLGFFHPYLTIGFGF